jgi:hypothetical protein
VFIYVESGFVHAPNGNRVHLIELHNKNAKGNVIFQGVTLCNLLDKFLLSVGTYL